jgi:hypothetical protein
MQSNYRIYADGIADERRIVNRRLLLFDDDVVLPQKIHAINIKLR